MDWIEKAAEEIYNEQEYGCVVLKEKIAEIIRRHIRKIKPYRLTDADVDVDAIVAEELKLTDIGDANEFHWRCE